MTTLEQPADARLDARFPVIDPTKALTVHYVISATMSNPNGDPDEDNAPRINPFDNHGIISATSVKRKIRDYVTTIMGGEPGYDLMVRHGEVIASGVFTALRESGVQVADAQRVPEGALEELREHAELLGNAFALTDEGVVYDFSLKAKDLKALTAALTDAGVSEGTLTALTSVTKQEKGARKTLGKGELLKQAAPVMVQRFYDARMFGYTAPDSAGTLRGPVQVTRAVSLAPVNILTMPVTRVARGSSAEGKDDYSQMGRTAVVDYGVYVGTMYYNAPLARDRGVTAQDLNLLLGGLYHGQDFARSSGRDGVHVEGLVIIQHDNQYGSVPAHQLRRRLSVTATPKGDWQDVQVEFDGTGLTGVTVTVLR